MTKKIPTVIIGLGRIGMLYGFDLKRMQPASHLRVILENPNFNLVGVCDLSKKSRNIFFQKYGKICNVFNSYMALIKFLKNNNINCKLFVIATPENTHFKIIQDIIKIFNDSQKKSIIFCEKPLTSNIESTEKIKKLINGTNFKLVVNHVRRWSKIWNLCFKKLTKIGKIESADFFFSTSPENKSLDQMRDGIHIADIINWYNIKDKIHVNRIYLPYLVYDFHIWGTRGKIEVLNNGEILNLYKKQRSQKFEGFFELKLVSTTKLKDMPLKNAYREFADFFNKKNIKLSTNINDALSALEIFKKHVYQKQTL